MHGGSLSDDLAQGKQRSKMSQLESEGKEAVAKAFCLALQPLCFHCPTDTQEGGSSRRHGTSMVSSASMGILHSSSLHDYTPVSRSENQDSLQVSPLTSFPFPLLCLPLLCSSVSFCLCKFSAFLDEKGRSQDKKFSAPSREEC